MFYSEPEAKSRKSKQTYGLNLKSKYPVFYPSKAFLETHGTNCEGMVVWPPLVPLGSLSFAYQCSSAIPENSHKNLCNVKIVNILFNNHNY